MFPIMDIAGAVKGTLIRNKNYGRYPVTEFNFRKLYPTTCSLLEYEPPESKNPDDEIVEKQDSKISILKVKSLDLKVAGNAKNHQTDEYDITKETKTSDGNLVPPKLVIRRGKEFTVAICFNRDLIPSKDKIRISLQIGPKPLISKGTCVHLVPDYMLKPRMWSSSVQSSKGNTMTVAILSPPNAIIGKWQLSIETSMDDQTNDLLRYVHKDLIYMIFNPFCQDDQVYMADVVGQDEYIMNETGKIYTGAYNQITYKPWNFNQFEGDVLDCCMLLLDKSKLNMQCRGDSIQITRSISAIVNSNDDDGVIVGNWTGDYTGGTAPTHWIGSAPILEEYKRTGKPVKYGQCWVFSGIVTTVCRALGIPARSVTNFKSAHDCDGSISIDIHWNEKGEPIDELNNDSIWNFHVWNEVYMSRPDLGPSYGGWQVIDATPQEVSMGTYCAGPMSVEAIKNGQVNLPYDGRFIFAEVNADRVHWIATGSKDPENEWKKIIEKNIVGHKISTKKARKTEKTWWNIHMHEDLKDVEDVTEWYKFPEGTESERAVVLRANQCSLHSDIYNQGKADVKFELRQKDNILVGSPFDVVLRAQNTSRLPRTIHAIMTLRSQHYTGQPGARGPLKRNTYNFVVQGIRSEDQIMRVSFEDYQHHIVGGISFEIDILASVAETGQVVPLRDVYRLRRPDLTVVAPETVKIGDEFTVVIKLASPMPIHLTKCEWMIEASGLTKMNKKSHKDLEPYDRAEHSVKLKATKPGERIFVASFDSLELRDIVGSATILVKE